MTTGHEVLPGAAATAGPAPHAGPATAEPGAPAGRSAAAGPMAGAGGPAGFSAGRGAAQAAWQAAGDDDGHAAGGRIGRARRGSGGRWLVWVLRTVVWAVVLLIGYRGVAAIVTGYSGSGAAAGGQAGQQHGNFPVSLAQAYALEFGQVYLNFSPATAAKRAAALAQFLPAGADPQLGWDGVGTQSLQSEQVAGTDVRGAHSAVVTLLARVGGHMIELAVPLYAAHGGLVVSGQPALLPPPASAAPPAPPRSASDPAAEAALGRRLPAFFRAFARGGSARLGTFTSGGARIGGLGGAVTFGGLLRVSVPGSSGAARHITVTVVWRTAGQLPERGGPSVAAAPAQIEMTYAMTVVKRGRTWYVQSIGAAAPEPTR